jgi:hypothetical protein
MLINIELFDCRVPSTCPRLLVNREKAGERNSIMRALGLSQGMDFDSPANSRDVAWLGDCDDGCVAIADLLGWGVSRSEITSYLITIFGIFFIFISCVCSQDELRKLVEEEHKRIDSESSKNKTEKSTTEE